MSLMITSEVCEQRPHSPLSAPKTFIQQHREQGSLENKADSLVLPQRP